MPCPSVRPFVETDRRDRPPKRYARTAPLIIRHARNGSFSPGKQWQDRDVDQLQTMKVFVRVAQRAGFAAAARDRHRLPAAVTKHVAALEPRLRSRLLDRTTRKVSLTEAGRVYL